MHRANPVAENKLRRKSRKRDEYKIAPTIESATVYTLQGFVRYERTDGNFLVTEVEHHMTGKTGNVTKVKLQRCMR